jgi:hypothetical protein
MPDTSTPLRARAASSPTGMLAQPRPTAAITHLHQLTSPALPKKQPALCTDAACCSLLLNAQMLAPLSQVAQDAQPKQVCPCPTCVPAPPHPFQRVPEPVSKRSTTCREENGPLATITMLQNEATSIKVVM